MIYLPPCFVSTRKKNDLLRWKFFILPFPFWKLLLFPRNLFRINNIVIRIDNEVTLKENPVNNAKGHRFIRLDKFSGVNLYRNWENNKGMRDFLYCYDCFSFYFTWYYLIHFSFCFSFRWGPGLMPMFQ